MIDPNKLFVLLVRIRIIDRNICLHVLNNLLFVVINPVELDLMFAQIVL